MQIRDCIGIYDGLFEDKPLTNLYKYAVYKNEIFEEAKVNRLNGNESDTNERDAQCLALLQNDKSLTKVHWHNYLYRCFINLINYYAQDKKFADLHVRLNNIEILRYKNQGHYHYHTDNCTNIPRTISIILMLNDNYEGGELIFSNPQMNHEEIIVKPKKGRAIIWPSNFLYPHKVNFVTKGIRYSVVCWAQ